MNKAIGAPAVSLGEEFVAGAILTTLLISSSLLQPSLEGASSNATS
jgi:hypothetical protein